MEVTFKYNGKIITTPDLGKKLKRMKISIDDIEIIEKPVIIKKESEGVEDYMLNKRQVTVRSTLDEIRRICYVNKDESLPTIKKLFEKQMWNGQTGIKGLTYEYLMTMYYEKL